MIKRNVVHDRDAGLEKCNGTVALVHLTDERVAFANLGAGKRRSRVDEIFHVRAVHDRRALASAMQNPANHANRGGFSAGTGDAHARFCTIEELRKKSRASGGSGTDTPRGL